MNKDVVYIDVEDDITAIIEKVKSAKEKIVALVPPKRVGVLQSAVNLRLLARTADSNDKRIVLITNNQALVALAASAAIPVAKNLQSKPEVPEITAIQVDDDDDMIDGQQLPVGEHAKTIIKEKIVEREINKTAKTSRSSSSEDFGDINIDDDSLDATDDTGKKVSFTKDGSVVKDKKPAAKIPNFDSFRNKLFFGIAAVLLLAGGLVWALVFAPAAKVIVTAATSSENVSFSVNLTSSGATDVEKNTIQTISKTIDKEVEVEFTATGTDTVGEKAGGTVIFKNCETLSSINLESGTTIVAGGKSYVTTKSVVVPGGSGGFSGCTSPGLSAPVSVSAADIGSQYNLADGTNFSVSGHPNGSVLYLRATANEPISGGSSREVTVVSQSDFDTAIEQLDEISDEEAKEELFAEFKNGEIILKDNVAIERSAPESQPAIGAEVSGGKAKLVLKAKYTVMALPKIDVQEFLKSKLTKQLENEATQRIYDDGIDEVSLSGYLKTDNSETVTIATNGSIGPNIDQDFVKNVAKGRSYGDVQYELGRINGVNDVDVQFSYFWVRTVPGSDNKIEVEFKLEDE